MSIYKKFCREIIDENGSLKHIELDYPENFNFGYDVVDAIAAIKGISKEEVIEVTQQNAKDVYRIK